MKKTFKNLPGLANNVLWLLAGVVVMSACNKNDNDDLASGGPPTIERVRLTDPTTKDSSLKQASLGSTIVVVGTNLRGAQTVAFNGYPITVNPTYATDNTVIVTISDSVPTVARNPNVPNELTVTTAGGSATFPFKVLPPRPEVNQISNEYAKPGQSITLFGRYFFFVDTVFFPPNIPVTTGITTSADGTTLTVTIPAGTDPSRGDVQVKSQSGLSAAGRGTKLYDFANKPGIVLNWDDVNNFGWGLDPSKKVTTAWPGITPIDGKYGVIDMAVPGNYGWSNDKVIDIDKYDNAGNQLVLLPTAPAAQYDPNAPVSAFDMKFELASTKPVGALRAQVFNTAGGKDYTYDVALSDFVKSADGKWYTVSANLGNLANGSSKLAKYSDLGSKSIRVMLLNTTASDINATVAIDNIRIMRVQ